ncbi:MAG: hypothetical protein MUF15_24875 [Acidobacteria bacterium]|jgi:hypothetical protein|nr:hypothetical protein [Acidobacteriota bacterium]
MEDKKTFFNIKWEWKRCVCPNCYGRGTNPNFHGMNQLDVAMNRHLDRWFNPCPHCNGLGTIYEKYPK